MKDTLIQGVAAGLLVVTVSMMAVHSLFFTRSEGETLQAKVVGNEVMFFDQLNRLHTKIDNLTNLIIKLDK